MDLLIPKVDQALRKAYLAYQETSAGEDDAGMSITLRFTGSIEPLVGLGFDLHAVVGDRAFGDIKFRNQPVFAKRAEMLRMSVGSRPKKDLDIAVKEIRGRAPNPNRSGRIR